ncbi:hypothetical protein [Litoreibacter roseus]|uniref:Uncharacterized protein n=1 Tax=Litoreibacter roseus TaxID=2601869 RepID=A0A6N6JMN3_9RHOB|nr:hypothetical protein [Litoreibacter roseus]GFE66558.1 hypothetical protein KIN_36320 [Litoreibacter roseus]
MERTSIFFRSDLFPADQDEIDYASREKHPELIYTNALCNFLTKELAKTGYSVLPGEEDQRGIYREKCQYLPVEHDEPFALGIFCGSYLDGHGILVHPQNAYAWKGFRRYHAEPVAMPLFTAIVRLLNETEGISELEHGWKG